MVLKSKQPASPVSWLCRSWTRGLSQLYVPSNGFLLTNWVGKAMKPEATSGRELIGPDWGKLWTLLGLGFLFRPKERHRKLSIQPGSTLLLHWTLTPEPCFPALFLTFGLTLWLWFWLWPLAWFPTPTPVPTIRPSSLCLNPDNQSISVPFKICGEGEISVSKLQQDYISGGRC